MAPASRPAGTELRGLRLAISPSNAPLICETERTLPGTTSPRALERLWRSAAGAKSPGDPPSLASAPRIHHHGHRTSLQAGQSEVAAQILGSLAERFGSGWCPRPRP